MCGGTVGDSFLSCASVPKTSAVRLLLLLYNVCNPIIYEVIGEQWIPAVACVEVELCWCCEAEWLPEWILRRRRVSIF